MSNSDKWYSQHPGFSTPVDNWQYHREHSSLTLRSHLDYDCEMEDTPVMPNRPLYPIGIVADLLNLHPETVREWERYGAVQPQRKSGRRFYSDNDLRRLRFVQKLRNEGLNKTAVSHYLKLYTCWENDHCPTCMQHSKHNNCGKPCWKEEGIYCIASASEDICSKCEFARQ